MMQAMPYNLQGKAALQVSGIRIPQITSSAQKWKPNLDKSQQQQQEGGIEQFHIPACHKSSVNTFLSPQDTTPRATSTVDGEPASTLDTCTSSASISNLSSFTSDKSFGAAESGTADNKADVADPACTRKRGLGPRPGAPQRLR